MRFHGHIKHTQSSNMALRMAIVFVSIVGILALFAPLIANDRPIYLQDESEVYWPAFNDEYVLPSCENKECKRIYPIVRCSPGTMDLEAILRPPGTKGHLLGTDALGRDVLSALIHGAKTAVFICVPATLLAFGLGLFYGLLCGFYGDAKIRISRKGIFLFILVTALAIWLVLFLVNLQRSGQLNQQFGLIITLTLAVIYLYGIFRLLRIRDDRDGSLFLPVDGMGMRLVDMVKAIPPLFIVLFALQLIRQPGMWSLIMIITFLLWATFTRHARAEAIRVRNRPSVQSATLSGRSDLWIWINEYLPLIVRPLFVTFSFSIASAILLEATLSFLGIGLPVEHVSWGTLINEARIHQDAWWLLVWPGIFLVGLIWSIQYIGHYLEGRLRFGRGMKFG